MTLGGTESKVPKKSARGSPHTPIPPVARGNRGQGVNPNPNPHGGSRRPTPTGREMVLDLSWTHLEVPQQLKRLPDTPNPASPKSLGGWSLKSLAPGPQGHQGGVTRMYACRLSLGGTRRWR